MSADEYIYVGTVLGLQKCGKLRKQYAPEAWEKKNPFSSLSRIGRLLGSENDPREGVDLSQNPYSSLALAD